MVEISINEQEVGILKEILVSYLSDLRMEIADTDQMDFREALKKKEQFLKKLIALLPENSI